MKLFKRLSKLISSLLFILTITILFSIIISVRKSNTPSVFGYSMLIVLTDSMEDTISVDDFIIIKKQKSYEIDDIVTFYGSINNHLARITHRIILVNEEEGYFITQGDKYINDDRYGYILEYTENVPYQNVIGKVVFISPFIGKILSNDFFQNKTFVFLLILVLLLFIIYSLICNLYVMLKKNK